MLKSVSPAHTRSVCVLIDGNRILVFLIECDGLVSSEIRIICMPLRTAIARGRQRPHRGICVLLGEEIYFNTAPGSGLSRVVADDRENEGRLGTAFMDASVWVQLRTLGG